MISCQKTQSPLIIEAMGQECRGEGRSVAQGPSVCAHVCACVCVGERQHMVQSVRIGGYSYRGTDIPGVKGQRSYTFSIGASS